jgi:hypothetical protein
MPDSPGMRTLAGGMITEDRVFVKLFGSYCARKLHNAKSFQENRLACQDRRATDGPRGVTGPLLNGIVCCARFSYVRRKVFGYPALPSR